MTRRIYVAGGSSEVDLVAGFMYRLRDWDWVVAHDWTLPVRQRAALGMTDKEMDADWANFFAWSDLRGIDGADYFWLLAPGQKSEGAWCEAGYAIGRSLHVSQRLKTLVSGPTANIFARGIQQRFDTHDEAFRWLTELSQ